MKRLPVPFFFCAALWLTLTSGSAAPAVQVTLKLDDSRIAAVETTTLHVFAQIVEAQRPNTDRIFSWYVDLLNSSGTTVSGLAADFIVAPTGGGDPLLGGDYSAASIDLEFTAGGTACLPEITAITPTSRGGGSLRVALTFTTCPGRNQTVEFRDSLGSGAWQPLPGGPHNSGSVPDISAAKVRFYRVSVAKYGTPDKVPFHDRGTSPSVKKLESTHLGKLSA